MSNEKLAYPIQHDTPAETASAGYLFATTDDSKTLRKDLRQPNTSPDELERKWLEIIGRLFNPLG